MDQINQEQYIAISKGFENKPFNLTNAWVGYQKKKGNKVLFLVDRESQPQIMCWARIKKIKFIGEVLDIEGPIYKKGVNVKMMSKFLGSMKELPYAGLFINLNTEYDVHFEEAIRLAGYKRPIGQVGTNLTIIIDPADVRPTRNWKRNIKKSEKVDFECVVKQDVTEEDCKVIADLHEENVIAKNLHYSLNADELYELVNHEEMITFFLYRDSKPIAARIVSIDYKSSHDVYACNSHLSREDGATQFLMQYIFNYLKENGIESFDFARIPLGNKKSKGVYEFKHAAGGKVIQYNGEWMYFKKMKIRHIYYLYNLIMNKKDFY